MHSSRESMAAYAQMRERLTQLLAEVDDATAARTAVPACPDWTVTELTAHVYGVARDVSDGNVAGAGTDAWAASQVGRFAPLGLAAMVAAWNELGPSFEESVAVFPEAIACQITFDSGAHEQDLRGALDRPGARDAATVRIGIGFMVAAMGALAERQGLPGVTFETPEFTVGSGTGPARVRLRSDTFTVGRALSGRRSMAQLLALPWEGDPTPYLAVFETSPIRPPVHDLIE
jgi:uncharacterized protein (TIGR03083 family)